MVNNLIAGNIYDKYETSNPIARKIVKNFLNAFNQFVIPLEPRKILEVGCGEGYLTNHLKKLKNDVHVEGVDLSYEIINLASKSYPKINFRVASVYNLPYINDSFDLVVAFEVLEHLDNPIAAIKEIMRVSNRNCLFSVPQEPIWRILNLFRGKYIGRLGNTPGHLQHWKRKEFIRLVGKYFTIREVKFPFPWTMVLCEK